MNRFTKTLILLLIAATHGHGETPANKSPEERLGVIFPIIGPLINPDMSKAEFIQGVLVDDRKRQPDMEFEIRFCEAAAAAWSRFEPTIDTTKEKRMIAAAILFGGGGVETAQSMCAEMKLNDTDCLTQNEVTELLHILGEEAAKRDLRKEGRKFIRAEIATQHEIPAYGVPDSVSDK